MSGRTLLAYAPMRCPECWEFRVHDVYVYKPTDPKGPLIRQVAVCRLCCARQVLTVKETSRMQSYAQVRKEHVMDQPETQTHVVVEDRHCKRCEGMRPHEIDQDYQTGQRIAVCTYCFEVHDAKDSQCLEC